MSRFSGKCDLADHIFSEKFRTKDGSDNPDDLMKSGVLYSDPMECFEIFKRNTGGVLHQHKRIKKVTVYNQDFIAEHCPQFEIIKNKVEVTDKRAKCGTRIDTAYTYKYWGKEYTAKELSKKGVYITVDIRFKTLLDLIPYLPYVVSECCYSDGLEQVYISDESYVEEEADDMIQFGHEYDTYHYRHELANFYKDCVLRYFNSEGRECVEEVVFDEETRLGKVSSPIDENFDLEWRWEDGEQRLHWTSPKVVDAEKGIIEISQEDLKAYLGNKMLVYYVKKTDRKLYLQ